jgi:CheY-like chemotaxis protein
MAKIMLVEDDNNLREIYEARLQAEGYTIVSAHDGEEALVIAKAEKPDLVISDVMMPKISGFEMLDILRNTEGLKEVKVIMLTALGQSDDQQRADKLGADRYLVKSQVTLEDIVKTAHDLLGDEAAAAASAAPEAPAAPPAIPEPSLAPVVAAPVQPAPTPDPSPAAPPAPAAASSAPQPATPPSPSQPSTAPTVPDAASDDKVMAEAVDKLIADTDKEAEKPAPETEPPKTDEPAQSDKKDDEAAVKESETETEDTSNSHVEIANKKVITPIDSSPGKDIHALLAEEEAKEAAATAGTVTEPSMTLSEASDAATTAAEEAAVDAKIEDFVAGATSEPDAPAQTPAASQPAPVVTAAPAAAPSQSSVKPIVISDEDAPSGAPAGSISGNPGVPAAAPADDKTPPDPSTIAL